MPVCDVSAGKCVECTAVEQTSCPDTKPICSVDHTCQGCNHHNQCASEVCLPNGSCDDGSDVAYVQEGSSGVECTKAAPCPLLSTALETTKPYIKVTGTIRDNVTIHNRDVTILSEQDAELTGNAAGNLIAIDGSSKVFIYDLQISGATLAGSGISMLPGNTSTVSLRRVKINNNDAYGVFASDGILDVGQSTLSVNGKSGFYLSYTTFQIANNFVIGNGALTGRSGGLVARPANRESKISFNTIVNNHTDVESSDTGGITCYGGIAARGNLIFQNTGGSGDMQAFGDCDFSKSLRVAPTEPGFKSATDYHLTAATPMTVIRDAIDCGGEDIDVDGDARPNGTKCDFGADEYTP